MTGALRILAAVLALAAAAPASAAAAPDPLGCLARTVYFEARGQPEEGLRAVAHVVLNRARSEAYPEDVCAVVRQG